MRSITYILLLISTSVVSQNYPSIKLALDSDEIIKESAITYKKAQDYNAFLKFKNNNRQKSGSVFSNTASINVPGIGGRVRAILVDSQNDIKLAAPSGGGLWRFETDGSSFTPVDDFAPFMTVTDISQNPFDANEIIISTGDEYHGIRGNGLFKSTDKGVTFTQMANTTPNVNNDFYYTRYIEYHPTKQGELYVVASSNLLKSTDSGVTWTQVYQASGRIKSIGFNHLNEVLISVDHYGIYKSLTSDLNTFTQITNGIPIGTSNLNIDNCIVSVHEADRSIVYSLFADQDPNDAAKLVGKIYKSTDGGSTWSYVGLTTHSVRSTWFVFSFAVHPTNPDILLGGSVGFGYSLDGGSSWVTTRGLEVDFHSISFDNADDNFAFIGYDQGIGKLTFDQTDLYWVWDGMQWIQQEHILQEEIGKEPGFNTSQIYYGDYYPEQYNDALVFGQQDGGSFAHFEEIDTRIFVGDGGSIFVNRQDPNKIIGCTQYGTLYKTELGLTPAFSNFTRDTRFTNNHSNFITDFVVNEADGDQVYFSTNTDIQRSLDFGDNYTSIYNHGNLSSIKMAVSEELDPSLYFTGYKSANSSTSLIKLSTASSSPTSHVQDDFFSSSQFIDRLKSDPNDNNTLYASTFNGDLLKVTYDMNNIASKTSIRGNASDIIFNVVIGVDDMDILIAGSNVGLLYSMNEGVTWVLTNEIPYCQVRDLKYRKEDQRLFVFTYGRGAWATTLSTGNCPPNYAGVDKLTGDQNSAAVYATDGIIQSDQTIKSQVDYNSGTFIEMLQDFEVQSGNQFRAYLSGCN